MSQAQHIVVVDDEQPAREMVGDYLRMHGYSVGLCDGGASLRAAIAQQAPDLIVLDLNMPEEDGLSIIRDLKKQMNVPIIMLTATASAIDRVVGLELGADDYLAKPCELRELLARIRVVLRRGAPGAGSGGCRGVGSSRSRGGQGRAIRHQMARSRCPGAARRERPRAPAHRLRIRAPEGLCGQSEAGAVPRPAAGTVPGARCGGLRPGHRPANHRGSGARSSPTRPIQPSSGPSAAAAMFFRRPAKPDFLIPKLRNWIASLWPPSHPRRNTSGN